MTEKIDTWEIFNKIDRRIGFARAICETIATVFGNKIEDDFSECDFDCLLWAATAKMDEATAMVDQLRKAA